MHNSATDVQSPWHRRQPDLAMPVLLLARLGGAWGAQVNNQQITEEIKREIKICIETNENENTTTQNLWDVAFFPPSPLSFLPLSLRAATVT